MPRAKHGNYDEEHHLPDNTGQAVGSGSAVWLQEQILATLPAPAGQALIDSASAHGVRRYEWLCEQLVTQGYAELAQAYHQRKREDAAALRIRDKERIIRQCQAQIPSETTFERRVWLEKQIEKAQKYLERHQEGDTTSQTRKA